MSKKKNKKNEKKEFKVCTTLSLLKTSLFQTELKKNFKALSKKGKNKKVETQYFGFDETGEIKSLDINESKASVELVIPSDYSLIFDGINITKPVDLNSTSENPTKYSYLMDFKTFIETIDENCEKKRIVIKSSDNEHSLLDIANDIDLTIINKKDKIKIFITK